MRSGPYPAGSSARSGRQRPSDPPDGHPGSRQELSVCIVCGESQSARMIAAALAQFCEECLDTMSPSDFDDLYLDLGVGD